MRHARRRSDAHRPPRALALGAVLLIGCAVALTAGRALTDTAAAPPAAPPDAAVSALDALAAVSDPLEQATARARAAVTVSRAALADRSAERDRRLETARDEVVASRLGLLALADSASDDERRAIDEVNRALQRLVLRLDRAR